MFAVIAVTNKGSCVFFLAFYISTIVLTMNLTVAFIVDAFISKYDANQQSGTWEKEVLIRFREAQVQYFRILYLKLLS
jgi:hypothetical protein